MFRHFIRKVSGKRRRKEVKATGHDTHSPGSIEPPPLPQFRESYSQITSLDAPSFRSSLGHIRPATLAISGSATVRIDAEVVVLRTGSAAKQQFWN